MPLAALTAHAVEISIAGKMAILAHSQGYGLVLACGSAMRTICAPGTAKSALCPA